MTDLIFNQQKLCWGLTV